MNESGIGVAADCAVADYRQSRHQPESGFVVPHSQLGSGVHAPIERR